MLRKTLFTSLLASSALALAVAGPAHATDKKDRAQEAIAAAEAKLHTAEGIGAGVETPALTANARAALMTAKNNLAAGHKTLATEQAIHASALADTAVGELQRRKDASIDAARAGERASAQAAEREATAAAQDRADAARTAATAQQQTADANARASAAEQAAASSAADATAARNAALLAQSQPTQVETTVTTQHQGAVVHRSTKARAPVRKPAATTTTRVSPSSDKVTTTTTVTKPPL